MIAYLSGTILAHTKDGAIIQAGNLGYEVTGNWLGRLPLSSQVHTFIYEYLENESIPRMIGCESLEARTLFLQLLTVQGVGPKMAGRIVDSISPDKLILAISTGDVQALSAVKGLGKKTAQKMILELGKILVTESTSANSDLYEALTSLRFTRSEIDRAIELTDLSGLNENQKLSAVLKTLGAK